MRLKISSLFLVVLATACHSRNNEIIKVEMVTGYCFGTCRPTVTIVDSALHYQFYGGEVIHFKIEPQPKGELVGYYKAKVSRKFWDSLTTKLDDINYKWLDTTYTHTIDDQSLEIFIWYNNKVKHIRAQSASLPGNVRETLYWIGNSYKTVKPSATRDTFKFGKVNWLNN
jgi:hypothetical protein